MTRTSSTSTLVLHAAPSSPNTVCTSTSCTLPASARFVEVAVFTGEQKDLKFGALREGKRKLKDKGRKAFSKLSSGRHSDHNQKDAKAAEGDDAGSLSSSSSSSSSDDEGGFSISPFSFRSDSSKFRFDPKRKYELDDVGRLRDLVESKHRDQPEVRLQAECVRPPSSVATTVSQCGQKISSSPTYLDVVDFILSLHLYLVGIVYDVFFC